MPRTCDRARRPQRTEKLHDTFTQFVGQTFYGQMIKSMRSTVGNAAYFNGGQGEKIFQGQLDQTLAEQMTKASADRFAEPLFHQQFPNVRPARRQANAAKTQTAGLNDLANYRGAKISLATNAIHVLPTSCERSLLHG